MPSDEILAGRMVIACPSLEELPPEAHVDREGCRHFGVRSNLTFPLSVGGEPPVGALGFNTIRERSATGRTRWSSGCSWSRRSSPTRSLESAHELSLRESEERLSLAADSAEAGLWTLDYGTGVFWVTERARAIFGYSPDEVVTHGASPGVGSSRRLGSRSGSHRAVRAHGRARRRGIPDRPPRRRPRALDRLPWAAPFHVHRRAGAPDGRLHRRHRAQARRGGASRERGSPGGGGRPRRPRVLRGGLRRTHRLRRRPVSRRLRHSPGAAAGPRSPWSSGWSTCIPTTASACWTSASRCTTGGWSGSPSSIATCIRPMGRGGFITWPASPRATPPDARSGRSASSATSRSAGSARRPCGSRTRRSSD